MCKINQTSYLTSLCLVMLTISSLFGGEQTVTIKNTELSVTFSELGAELQSIRHVPTDTEYLWQGDPEYWAARSPNMFPVCVRFKDDHFTYQGTPYEMPRLGIASTARFETVGKSAHENHGRKVSMVLNSSEKTRQYYPFPFQLEIAGEVSGLTLTQTYTVTNTGAETLYFALGGHPGLRAPFIHGRERADYEMRFSDNMHMDRVVIANGLLTGNRIPYLQDEDRLTLDDPRIPDGGMLLQDHSSRQISLALKDQAPYVTLDLGSFPNTNIWTPPGMPYVCIEPMVGHHDLETTAEAIEEKEYLIHLPAGKSRSYQFSITIHPEEGVRALR